MRVHGWCVWVSFLVLGCGGSAPPPANPAKLAPAPEAKAPPKPAASRGVEVTGLEGTLQAYDVRETMNRRLDALAACQQERIRRVRHLAGSIELAIHVRTDGSVSRADVIESDLGDVATERCIAQVTLETRFPRPHGGEADVKWNMTLDPLGRPASGSYEETQLAEHLELNLPDLAEHCEMTRRSPTVNVTAYVAPSGKVIAAGASSAAQGQDALLTCAAEQVGSWRLPRVSSVAKVQLEARYRPPLNDARRAAIRKKHARRRKAEYKRKQAEARREKKRRQAEARQRKKRARPKKKRDSRS